MRLQCSQINEEMKSADAACIMMVKVRNTMNTNILMYDWRK
jgi:hypothetical protein